jgi:glycosyltransferase involved in cell wall biosynthesis
MHIIFCIPRIDNTGPSKGLVALANELQKTHFVSIVYFKNPIGRKSVTEESLRRNILIIKGNRKNIKQLIVSNKKSIVVSMCFSSDVLSIYYFWKNRKVTFIRGNFFANYRHDYGVLGIPLALLHYQLTRLYDSRFVLNNEEKERMNKLGIRAEIVHNCLDESLFGPIDYDTDQRWDVSFVGNLNTRKRPDLILRSLYEIKLRGIQLKLVIVGDGPLLSHLKTLTKRYGLCNQVDFVGHTDFPYSFLSQSRIFVLPSLSEGTSRALMEAAYHGNLCVIRDIECNYEFAEQNSGFFFFQDDKMLTEEILRAYELALAQDFKRKNQLPPKLRQKKVTALLLEKLQNLN